MYTVLVWNRQICSRRIKPFRKILSLFKSKRVKSKHTLSILNKSRQPIAGPGLEITADISFAHLQTKPWNPIAGADTGELVRRDTTSLLQEHLSRQMNKERGKMGANWKLSEVKSLSIILTVQCCVPWGTQQCSFEPTINSPSSSREEGLEPVCTKGVFPFSKSYKQSLESCFPWGLLLGVT